MEKNKLGKDSKKEPNINSLPCCELYIHPTYNDFFDIEGQTK
jgi:hypothetical protein